MNKYPHWKKTGQLAHRDVAAKFYGREIEEDEVVHHVDGIRFSFVYFVKEKRA